MRTEGNGGRPPQEIQAEIDRTRREMDGTLTAIEHRLSPGQLIDQGMSYLRQNGAQEFVSNLSGQAKQNPMPVALVGIGIAWLMASGKIQAGAETGASKLGEAKDRIGQTADKIGQAATAMRERSGQVGQSIDSMMREQPLALGALGLALGAVAAAFAPRTGVEDRIAGAAQKAASTEKSAEPVHPSVDPAVDVPPPFRGG